MTKQQVLTVATVVSGLGAGVLLFVSKLGDDGLDTSVTAPPMFEMLDRSACTPRACGAAGCQQANDWIADAGLACTVGFAECSVRVGPVARAIAADAGVTLGSQLYQRLRFIGMRCHAADGGFASAIPVDDNGWPLFAVVQATPLCVRAPLDGGTDCLRDDGTGAGPRFFGTGNVFSVTQSSGTQCEPVECVVFAGDDPDTSL